MNFISLLFTSVLLNVSANLLLKSGVNSIGVIFSQKAGFIADFLKVALNPMIISGLCLYALSFMVWLRVLSFNDLSRAYPLFATSTFLLTLVGSILILKESISIIRIFGIVIMISGIYIVARS